MNNKALLKTIDKYKAFYKDDSPGQILAYISPYNFEIDYTPYGIDERPLNQWNFDNEADAYVDTEVKKLRAYMAYTKDLDNDYIPSICPFVGIGVNSAYYSEAEVTFGPDTSWTHHCIDQWEDMNRLKMNEKSHWFKLFIQMAQRMKDLCEGDYAHMTALHFAPSDMVNALRGNQLFLDFYDHPDQVHKLMDLSADAIIWLQKELMKITGLISGGSIVSGMWMPGEALYLSEDAPDLCSTDIFKEFGLKYTQKVIDQVGSGFIHHHAKGWHNHKEIGKLRNLNLLEMSWDPNCPRPIDHIGELIEMNSHIPFVTRCTPKDVYEKIDEIKKR